MLYFNTLPKVYTPDQNNNLVLMTNLMSRAKIIDDLKDNVSLFYKYTIKDGDTPEIIAHKYYGDSYKYWIILYSNQITDPQWQWPMNDDALIAYLENKYATEASSTIYTPYEYIYSTVYKYEKMTAIRNNELSEPEYTYTAITEEDYNALTPSSTTKTLEDGSTVTKIVTKRALSILEYERELNESRRIINIMNEAYVGRMERLFEELMSTDNV